MSKECVFVFVVCGAREHIDALHYSLAALQKFSTKRILILTDSSRNEVPIDYVGVIDILTPEKLNHHQASIYLKTGLYKYLPVGNLYCYLDTDVVALSLEVDMIFGQYTAPITFAPDHCVADQFSPSAMKCGCRENYATWEKELKQLFVQYKDLVREPENLDKKKQLEHKLSAIKKNKIYYHWIALRFNLSKHIFKLDEDNFLDKKRSVWVDKNGHPILYEKDIRGSVDLIEKNTPYRIDKNNHKRWYRDGLDVFDVRCSHLQEAIKQEFGVEVKLLDWQHWNGGVFLFDDSSVDFLSRWHEKTLRIFDLPNWKTRDQGTLIATVWEAGLQNHRTLSRKYNLIADYGHKKINYLNQLTFQFEDGEIVEPAFIHIYHHWADLKWNVWKDVEQRTGAATDPDASTINSLWIGTHLSKLELLTLHSFLKFGFRFKLWLYEPLQHELPEGILVGNANEIIPADKVFRYKHKSQFGHGKGSVAGFSDIFRYKLLLDKGGWWVDMDITCLQPLDIDKPYFFRQHHHLTVVGNIMKCPKGSELMRLCYEEAINEVNEHNTDWHKPIDILNKHIAALDLSHFIVGGVTNQDRWDDTGAYVYTSKSFPGDWSFVHWQNEEWRNQKLNKNNFPYRGTLAQLMTQYGLYEPPKSAWEEKKNNFIFSPFFRKAKRIYFRLISPH
jgi:hypothetical protein